MSAHPNKWSDNQRPNNQMNKAANTHTSSCASTIIQDLKTLKTFFAKISEPPTTQQLQQFYQLMAHLNNNFAQGKFSQKTYKDAIAFQNTVMQYMANPNQAALIFLENQINIFINDLMKC